MENNQKQLVDVIELSKKRCGLPIECKLVYATQENFLGRSVQGYHPDAADFCLLTPKAADALCKVQNHLNQQGLGLFIFDGYRPLQSVKDFCKWMHEPAQSDYELKRKAIHYPHIEKNQLAELGYVCDTVSEHCFGDTVDLSLIDLKNKELLEMGAVFDYFDELSHITATEATLGSTALKNRQILSAAMQHAGFRPYEKEYWHFTFCEREIETPMDFEITAEHKGARNDNAAQ